MFTLYKSRRVAHGVTVRSHSPSWPRLSSSPSQEAGTISASPIQVGTKMSAAVLYNIQRQEDIYGGKKSSSLESLDEGVAF